MTNAEITKVAMYLLAKSYGLNTNRRSVIEAHWHKYHPVVHREYRDRVREVVRGIAWAAEQSSEGEKP